MSETHDAIIERTKALGALLEAARTAAGRSIEECAIAVGIPTDIYQTYEAGDQSPSLPELEGLAFYLDVPLDYFWETKTTPSPKGRQHEHMPVLIQIRQRMIGAMVRHARLDASTTTEQLATWCEIDEETLEAIELGQQPVPVPLLEIISRYLNRSIHEFQDRHGPVGKWSIQQRALGEITTMTPEMQEFISNPVNRSYLELAMRLSEMSVDRLRAVAESLLEITY